MRLCSTMRGDIARKENKQQTKCVKIMIKIHCEKKKNDVN